MSRQEIATPREAFWAAVRDTVPLIVGAIPFGIIFGALAVAAVPPDPAPLSPGGALAMSAFVFAGSAQFIAVGMIADKVALSVIVVTTLVVNIRHMLYSASLGPYLKHIGQRWLIPLGFWLTDETYLVVIRRYQEGLAQPLRQWYFLGSAVAMYINWQLSTLVGVVAGQYIEKPEEWGLEFALYVTFIGMTVSAVKSKSAVVSVIVAGIVAVAANRLPNNLGLILAALAGVAGGMIAKSLLNETPVTPVEVEGDAS